MSTSRFDEIEGFRAYLAIWVVVGHVLQFSGIGTGMFPVSLLLRAGNAVDLFIILSGFVITHLIIEKKEGYFQFAVRRFFRLFPAFAVCVVFGYLTTEIYLEYVATAPVPQNEFWTEFQAERAARYANMVEMLPQHIMAHLTMLHGAIPNDVLPHSAVMFLAPAWSISLEWQFYILAPFVIWALNSRVGTFIVILMAVVIHAAYARGLLGSYTYQAALPAAVGYFAIGIASRMLFYRLKKLKLDPAVVAICAAAFVIWFAADRLPLLIWTAFFSYLLFSADRVDSSIVRGIVTNRIALALGKVSYSIYLVHVPIIIVFGSMAVHVLGVQNQTELLAFHFFSVLATIAISYVLFYTVEKPGIRLGNKLAYGRRARAERAISAI